MDKIKTLLVDDEYLALNVLEGFAAQVPMIEIVAKVKSPLQAMEVFQQNNIALLYLDIEMPGINGNQFLRTLPHPPVTIFTTAYSEFAVEAFDLGATDYLVKPFSFERFLQATQKAIKLINPSRNAPRTEPYGTGSSSLSVKADGKIYRIALKEILFVEGLKEYLKIVTETKTFITLATFKNLETLLPYPQFIRVHKSFMVARDKVSSLDGGMLEIGKVTIPISREKKDDLVKIIFS
jgi:DNA-binding LytR/AlgR family response regulator